jgi:hypothetical protein
VAARLNVNAVSAVASLPRHPRLLIVILPQSRQSAFVDIALCRIDAIANYSQ